MVSDGDILQMTLQSEYDSPGNQGLNVFQYEVAFATPWSLVDYGQQLVEEWYNLITSVALQNMTSTIVNWRHVYIVNLSDPDEVYDGVPDSPVGGALTGDCLPPYASWGFLLKRSNASLRNGYKRFWGVPESAQLNGEPTAGIAPTLVSAAAFLGSGFDLELAGPPDINPQFYPAIVRKDETGAIIASQRVLIAQFRGIGTQNTRKFGRGM